jgi:hypothetical protein
MMMRLAVKTVLMIGVSALFVSIAVGHPPGGEPIVHPFLGKATPTSIHIAWETSNGTNTRVTYGTTKSMGSTVNGSWSTGFGAARVHHVDVEGLQPDTRYFYRCVSSPYSSEINTFRTPPAGPSGETFTFSVYSDCQYGSNGVKHYEVINDGIIDFYADEYGGNIEDSLAFVMIPGDLVSTGSTYSHWTDHFFGQAANLYKNVPLYPALGNHEANADLYYLYFDLFDNAPAGLDEHCYWFDYENTRVITLDSNGYGDQDQLDWLDGILADACADEDIDFVFVQFHHPHKSEAWTPGERSWSTAVVSRVEQFSTDCGKPSIHFFGHTHSYSRGQSRDHDHLMVNVATGMGSIDYWWDYPNHDYEEFQITLQEWGFVQLEVTTGDDPSFRLRRVSRGNDYVFRDNEITDEITVRVNNTKPDDPTTVSPTLADGAIPGDNVVLDGSLFVDADGDPGLESRWQVATSPGSFGSPVIDEWKRRENWYRPPNGDGWYSVDTVTDPDITRITLDEPLPGCSTLYWRVQYRDEALGWSDWSSPAAFSTAESSAGNSAPIPMPDSDGVDPTTHLEWFPCEAAKAYDVYFGTTSTLGPGDLKSTQSATVYNPGELDLETRYYWRIDRHENGKVVEGPTWMFQTMEPLPTVGTAEWRFSDENPSTGTPFFATHGESIMTPMGMNEGSDWVLTQTDGTTIPHINGVETGYIMLDNVYGSGSGLETYYMAPGNGGGGCCDVFHFTIIWDIFIPTNQFELQCLWQGNANNANEGEFFLSCSDGGFWVSDTGYIGEKMWPKGEWFRIAHRVDYASNTSAIFVNGVKVLADDELAGADWLYAGGSGSPVWMISDDGPDSDVSEVYCANLAIVDRLLPDATIANLGGPHAGGIIEPETTGIPGDFDGDGSVDGSDLAFLLGHWGQLQGDLDGNGSTDGGALAILLGYWTL